MHATLRKSSRSEANDVLWRLADQVLTSEGGVTLLFLIPAMATFFIWASLPPL